MKHTVLLCLALHAGALHADEPETPVFSFGGFGTLGVVHSSENRADFTSTTFKPGGSGFTRSWSFDPDTLIAGQVTGTFTSRLSGVLQVVAEQDYRNSYRPLVEWVNLKYQFTPEFSARIGRTVLPIYLVSDSRRVGYANPWVRPPIEVYSLVPVTSNDGVDASYRVPMGKATATFHVTVGRSNSNFPGVGGNPPGTVEARKAVVLVGTLEQEFATARFTCSRVRVTIDAIKPMLDAFRLFGPEGVAIADKYPIDNSLSHVCVVGATYDPGDWFAMAEWGNVHADPGIGNRRAWYVTGGYRIGKFTPYLTYASADAEVLSDPGLTVAALPPFLAGPATELNAALNGYLSARTVQDSISLGVRWDFARKAAFKLQYDHMRIGAGSSGALHNTQPGYQLGGKVNVISATLDFVF